MRSASLIYALSLVALISVRFADRAVAAGLAPAAQDSSTNETGASRAEFLAWARKAVVPLSSLARASDGEDLGSLGMMIGDASVVSLGEGDHFVAQPLVFRNAVLRYLVEEKGFTAIAIESGIIEGRLVHDYVRGLAADLRTVVSRGISWTFDKVPQSTELVRWLRDYNADPRHTRKINFYGFDVPGSPGNPRANRGMETALVEALHYLERVDRAAAVAFHARVDRLLPSLRFDRYHPDTAGYHRLTQAERDALTLAIADLYALLQAREAPYEAASSPNDYQWALRASIGARQVDNWLRQIPLEWRSTDEQLRFLDIASDFRDRGQAENLQWIVQREGPAGKVLIFAHNGHLSTAPVKWNWWPLDGAGQYHEVAGAYPHEVAGVYLRRLFGDRLVTIGNVMGEGEIGCLGNTRLLKPVPPRSIDALAKQVGPPLFLLDLRNMPAGIGEWLDQERPLGYGFELSSRYRITLEVRTRRAFDILFYTGTVTPACGRAG